MTEGLGSLVGTAAEIQGLGKGSDVCAHACICKGTQAATGSVLPEPFWVQAVSITPVLKRAIPQCNDWLHWLWLQRRNQQISSVQSDRGLEIITHTPCILRIAHFLTRIFYLDHMDLEGFTPYSFRLISLEEPITYVFKHAKKWSYDPRSNRKGSTWLLSL